MCQGPVAGGNRAHTNEFNRVPGARARKRKRNTVQHGSREPGRNQRRQELVGHNEGLCSTKLLASMIGFKDDKDSELKWNGRL